jgi:hypothetical protein
MGIKVNGNAALDSSQWLQALRLDYSSALPQKEKMNKFATSEIPFDPRYDWPTVQ